MVYTTEEIKRRITPIAEKYEIHTVYLFGSYARNEASEISDVDVLIDTSGSNIEGWTIGGLYNDLCDSLEKGADIVTVAALNQNWGDDKMPQFAENVMKEKVLIYERK